MRQRSASFQRRLRPPLSAAAFLVVVIFIVVVSNGRPIGAGDTRPTERVAASLVGERDFDLDEYPEVSAPFARRVGEHRLSIYPVLSAVMAAPIFAIAGSWFALDETGTALAGKLAAALFSSLAAGLLFLAIGRRHFASQATAATLVFALGTSVWSTSQALWQHPAAVLFLCLALLMMVRIDDEPEWAARAGLPLGLAVAARHTDVALVAVLWVSLAARYPEADTRARGLESPGWLCLPPRIIGCTSDHRWPPVSRDLSRSASANPGVSGSWGCSYRRPRGCSCLPLSPSSQWPG